MSDVTVYMKLYGGFRKFGDVLELSVPAGCTVSDVKSVLQDKMGGEQLVMDSVIANDDTILKDAAVIDTDTQLSILPPVCGG